MSGQRGRKYQNEEKFLYNGINAIYYSYIPIKYKQESNSFLEGVMNFMNFTKCMNCMKFMIFMNFMEFMDFLKFM